MLEMSTEEASRVSQNAGTEQITAENMALLCSKNIKLDIAPIQIPDIAVAQVSVCCVNRTVRGGSRNLRWGASPSLFPSPPLFSLFSLLSSHFPCFSPPFLPLLFPPLPSSHLQSYIPGAHEDIGAML